MEKKRTYDSPEFNVLGFGQNEDIITTSFEGNDVLGDDIFDV